MVLILVAMALPAGAGDNSGSSTQEGRSTSGDAIAGPSAGFSSRGDISVRMTNRIGTDDEIAVRSGEGADADITNVQGPTSVASGAATGANESSLFVGLQVGAETDVLSAIFGAPL